MRRTLIALSALALVPFAAVSPAAAGTATPAVITPTSGPATLSLMIGPDDADTTVRISRLDGTGIAVARPGDVVGAELTATWDGKTSTGGWAPDGTYVAQANTDDSVSVRVNLRPPASTQAPGVSATNLAPWADGYRDAITITTLAPTTEIPAATTTQVLDARGTVVWSSSATSARWTGRNSAGKTVAPGTYRVRARYTDTDGLTGYSPTRAISVSAVQLRPVNVRLVDRPKAMYAAKYVGRCGKIVKPARTKASWKGSLAVSSNHRCTRKGAKSITAAYFAIKGVSVYDYQSLTVKAVGGGHTAARRNAGAGFALNSDGRNISTARRLSPKYGTRKVFSASGSALAHYVDRNDWIVWAVATSNGGRYDIKRFVVTLRFRQLFDPTKRSSSARLAPATVQLGR